MHTSKAYYYHSMIQLAGGLQHLHFLREPYMLRMLDHAQVKKGASFTLKELAQMAHPRQHHAEFMHIMTTLAAKNIFLRGYRLTCPVCDLTLWYELAAVQEHTPCRGCLAPIQPALDVPFAFRLNHLFCMGLNQGAAAVLLTLLWLHEVYQSVTWEACVMMEQTEVDLVVQADNTLFLIECKNTPDAVSDEQTARLRALAASVGGEFRLAVLDEHRQLQLFH